MAFVLSLLLFSLVRGKIKSADQYSGPGACEDLHIVLEHKK